MPWERLARVVGIVGLCAVAGCSAKPPVQITAAADGQHIQLPRGAELVLDLAANPATGYRWEILDAAPAALVTRGERYDSQAKLGQVGGGGTSSWRFRAVHAARDTLRLAYRRPWERDIPPARTFTCVVEVR